MVDPYMYVTRAKERVWLAIRGDPIYVRTLVEGALEKSLKGVDVRIITDDIKKLNEIISDFVYIKRVPVKNVDVMEMQVADDIYVIDDKAWTRVNGRLTYTSVKESERKFEELWKEAEKRLKELLDKRIELLTTEAKKRVLAVIPRIRKDDAYVLIGRAMSDVDVYVITNDKTTLTSTMERFMRDIDRELKRIKRWAKFVPLILAMPFLVFAAFIGLPILIKMMPSLHEFLINNTLSLLFVIPYVFAVPFGFYAAISYFFDLGERIDGEHKIAEKAFEMAKDAPKRLNVLEAPVTEEFYVVDNRAWEVKDDKLIAIDAWDAERKFAELWRLYEGPLILGKDVK